MDPDAKKRRLEALMGGAGASSGFGLAGAAGAPPPAVAGPSSAVEPLAREAFQVSANEALSFRLVRTAAELDSAPSFSPDFTHQVFREDETIWGYKDLQIVISLHALSFHALVEVSHSGTAPSALGPPDAVLARLKEAFPAGLATDRAAFLASLLELGPAPPLPGGATRVVVAAPPSCVALRVVHLALTTADARAWHARLAPLVLFFIDAGTHLETEADTRWELLVALLPAAGGGEVVAGFATLYRFFAFPDRKRLRLSQVLVAPPMQRRGVAGALLGAVRALAGAADAVDYTVEDPTDDLQRLREVTDLRAARAMPDLAARAVAAVAGASSAASPDLRRQALELPPDAAQALRSALRLCKPQMRVVWEGLLFLAARDARCDPQGPAASAFRDLLSRRLKGSGADARAQPPRKFVLDLEPEGDADAPELALGEARAMFLMAKGTSTGTGRTKAAAMLDENAAEAAASSLEELLGLEMQRLQRLATTVQ